MVSRHDGVDVQGKWLAQVLRDWMAYYAVPMSGSEISCIPPWTSTTQLRGHTYSAAVRCSPRRSC